MAYTSLAEVRAMDVVSDVDTYPDAEINAAIALAEINIDKITGTAWTHKAITIDLVADGSTRLFAHQADLRTITAATVDGASVSVDGWSVSVNGVVTAASSISKGVSVSVTCTYGATTTPPEDIQFAARELARWEVLEARSANPRNSISITTEFGPVGVAVASGGTRQTSLPAVNIILARRSHRIPGVA